MNMKVGDLVWVKELPNNRDKIITKISSETFISFIVGRTLNFSKTAPHVYKNDHGVMYEIFEITKEDKVKILISKLKPERILMYE